MAESERTVYLVDGTSNLHRAFHAIPELSNSRGIPTNAVYGFTNMLRKLIRTLEPRYMTVAFDLPEPTFRHRAYADYKANRPPAPENLVAQIPHVKRVCRALSVPMVELAGYEADDLIATLAEGADKAGFHVVIVASDKDLLQLVRERVRIYNPVSEQFLDGAGVERVFGVRPEQVPDVLALWGDSSDNIPGVPGIGEKGAKQLIRRFGDLDAALNRAAEVEKKSYREALEAHAEIARVSRDLATLRRDAPVSFEETSLPLEPPDFTMLRDLFQELEFTALLREFTAPVESPPGRHEVIVEPDHLERAVTALRTGGVVGINVERDHPQPMLAHPVGLALAGVGGVAYYVPLAHRAPGTPRPMDLATVLRLVRPLLVGDDVRRVGHNVKSDVVLLRRLGEDVSRFDFDTMIASYLLNASRRSHTIDAIAGEVAGLDVPGYETVLGSGAKRIPLTDVDIARTAALVCARLQAVMVMCERLRADLEAGGLMSLLSDMELPLSEALADAERVGVAIDPGFLARLSSEWEGRLAELTSGIHQLAGKEFNINSPKQLGEILFVTLNLRPGRRTRKTRSLSTGAEVLEDLAESHELPRRILEYRTLQKLKSGYVDALPQLVNPGTGRVHTSFNQAVAATGRLSSSDPNLQNIPIRSELGRQIRRAFIAAEGFRLLSADYSQIELRVLAHLSGDPGLTAAFRTGEDIHRRTAADVFGVLPELVTDEMRRRAKAVNFGIIYGMGPQRLARDQGISLREAGRFIEEYFSRFPKVKDYINATTLAVEADCRVRTLFGRVRYFPEIRGSDRNTRQQAIRAAVNTTIQGTAADLIKIAMVTLVRRLRESRSSARVTLQVHDELVLEVPENDIAMTARLVRSVMERVHPLDVPLVVDVSAGPNWLDMEPLSRSKD